MKQLIILSCASLALLYATTAVAYNEGDDRDSRLCADLVTPIAYEVSNHKKQGYSPEESYEKLAGSFKAAMAKKPKAQGAGSEIINDFNTQLTATHVKFIRDAVIDAANRPFYNADKAYPQYILRCIAEVKEIKAGIAEKYRDKLQQFKD